MSWRIDRLGIIKRPSNRGKHYSNKDNARFKIILWLEQRGEAIQNSMFKDTQAGLAAMKWIDLTNRLDELTEWGIIKKKQSTVVSSFIYSLTDEGRAVAKTIHELKDKHPELINFEAFWGIR